MDTTETTNGTSFSMSNIEYDISTLTGQVIENAFDSKIIPMAVLLAATTLVNPFWENIVGGQKLTFYKDSHAVTISAGATEQKQYVNFDESIEDKIYSYLDYEDDWDGYGGVAATAKAVVDANLFLRKLSFDIREPFSGLSGDGEIGIFWQFDNIFIDIGFLGEGTYTMYAKDSEGIEYFKNEIQLDEPLPEALINLITIK